MSRKIIGAIALAVLLIAPPALATETVGGVTVMTIAEARAIAINTGASGIYSTASRYSWELTNRINVTGESWLDGDVTIGGSTTLGDATGDGISIKGSIGDHVNFKSRVNTISCGSGATQITGSGDERGGVNFSTGTTTCQITFVNSASTWTNAPFCTATLNANKTVWVSAVSTSSVTFTMSASESSGDKLWYHCDGGN